MFVQIEPYIPTVSIVFISNGGRVLTIVGRSNGMISDTSVRKYHNYAALAWTLAILKYLMTELQNYEILSMRRSYNSHTWSSMMWYMVDIIQEQHPFIKLYIFFLFKQKTFPPGFIFASTGTFSNPLIWWKMLTIYIRI